MPGAIIGGIASLVGGALQDDPEQPRQYPELRHNPIASLALIKRMLGAPKYDYGKLPSAPSAPGVPDFATTLAKYRGK